MPSRTWCMLGLAWLVLLPFCSGCWGERVVSVTGTATLAGEPVPDLVINFVPEKGERSFALTDAQGRFTMRTSSGRLGVVAGTHKIWVQLRPAGLKDDKELQQRFAERQADPKIAAMLKQYGSYETTPITKEIQHAEDIKLTLD